MKPVRPRRRLRPHVFLYAVAVTSFLLSFVVNINVWVLQPTSVEEHLIGSSLASNAPKESMVTFSEEPYPLESLGITTATISYQRGFSQQMAPVPLQRWDLVSNTTCMKERMHNQQSPLASWQYSVPYMVMIGSQKGGTTALSYYLYNHPQVQYLPSKELQFFDVQMDQNRNVSLTLKSGIHAKEVLQYYQEYVVGKETVLDALRDQSKVVLDATPNYLFLSDRVPQRLFCVAPWVKLLAVLRDPVERAFSQYHMQLNHDLQRGNSQRGGYVTFEEYVELDMAVLQEVGVIRDWKSQAEFDAFAGSSEEFWAWQTYTKLGLNSPIGRGLYSLQLRHWFQAMDSFNKSRSDLWIIPSQRLFQKPNETYADVLQFLGLKPHVLKRYSKIHATTYYNDQQDGVADMMPATKAKLQNFFKPYNRHLVDILGKEWDVVWEHYAR